MKVVSKEEAQKGRERIDYAEIADNYNRLGLEEALLLEPVYNITLFRRALSNWGVKIGVDIDAFGKNGKTLVKRLSATRMTKE